MSAAGWLQLAGAFVSVQGSREAGRLSKLAGERSRVAAEFNALELERQAGIAIALSQRTALEEQRLADVAASRALAVAAASGAGVSDPTIMNILARTKGEGTYRASVALYEGEERARQFRIAAISERIGGSQAMEEGAARAGAYNLQAIGTMFRTGSSLYAKYGGGGPDAASVEGAAGSGDARLLDTADYGGP
jgi:hypothetical protein